MESFALFVRTRSTHVRFGIGLPFRALQQKGIECSKARRISRRATTRLYLKGLRVSARRAAFTQADVQRVSKAAKKEGLATVEVRKGDTSVILHLCQPEQKPIETDEEISL